MLSNKTILIISPESWGDIKLSKHHYSIELSKRDNNVYFLNPPTFSINKNLYIENVMKNLCVIHYNQLKGINRFPIAIRDLLYKRLAQKILQLAKTSIDILWTFDPYRFPDPKVFKPKLTIYHPTDIHYTKLECNLLRTTDFIFAPSSQILNRFNTYTKKHLKINHGLADHFLKKSFDIKVHFIVNSKRINVGLVGNLNYPYFDDDTLIFIIRNNPNIDFYFIGPREKSNLYKGRLRKRLHKSLFPMSNFFFIGPKPSTLLPDYIHQFDLFLLCYDSDKYMSELANPHKIMEFMSTGKTIVSHYIDEYRNCPELVIMSLSNDDLPQLFSEVVDRISYYNSEQKIKIRKRYAAKHLYANQLDKIDSFISKLTFNF